MNFEFLIGIIFLVMLFFPNILWSRNKPPDYDKHVKNENKVLLSFERLGQVLIVCFSFISFSKNSIVFLIIAFILMVVYEFYWISYFKSDKTMADMYKSFLKIPVAGATLPVLAFFVLGIYYGSIFLIISTLILGFGHIGLHLNHSKISN